MSKHRHTINPVGKFSELTYGTCSGCGGLFYKSILIPYFTWWRKSHYRTVNDIPSPSKTITGRLCVFPKTDGDPLSSDHALLFSDHLSELSEFDNKQVRVTIRRDLDESGS